MIFNYICLYHLFDQLAPEFFCLLFVFHIYYLFFTYFTQWHFQNLSLSLVFCLFVCLVVFTCLWWPLLGCEQKGGLSRANRPVKGNGEEGPQQCKAAENGAKYWTQVKWQIKKTSDPGKMSAWENFKRILVQDFEKAQGMHYLPLSKPDHQDH